MPSVRSRWCTAVSVIAVLALAAGCADDDGDEAGPPPSTVGPDVELVEGLALTLDPASGYGAVGGLELIEGPDSCRGWQGSLAADGELDVLIAVWGDGCVATEGLNGQRVQYRAVADVVSGEVVDTREVPAGTATAIDDVYVECTNEYDDRIVLVELADPLDPAYPSVMISTLAEVSFDDLMAIAAALRVG